VLLKAEAIVPTRELPAYLGSADAPNAISPITAA
jgi:hypothetical protein